MFVSDTFVNRNRGHKLQNIKLVTLECNKKYVKGTTKRKRCLRQLTNKEIQI